MGLVNNCLTPRYISAWCILNIAENNLNRNTFDLCILVTKYWNFLSPRGIILPKIIWPDANSNSTVQPLYPLDTSIYGISICNGDNEWKLKIKGIFLSPRGITLPKIIRPDPNSNSNLRILVTNLCTEFTFKMSICNGDNERKLKINGIFLSPRGVTPAENYSTEPKFELNLRILVTNLYTEFQFKMSICNGENERKLKINGIFSKSKGRNSFKKWGKLMAFELDLTCITIKWYTKYQINMSKHVGEKCGKLWRTDGRRPGRTETRTDGHHHTIIRPVWRRAYKNHGMMRKASSQGMGMWNMKALPTMVQKLWERIKFLEM